MIQGNSTGYWGPVSRPVSAGWATAPAHDDRPPPHPRQKSIVIPLSPGLHGFPGHFAESRSDRATSTWATGSQPAADQFERSSARPRQAGAGGRARAPSSSRSGSARRPRSPSARRARAASPRCRAASALRPNCCSSRSPAPRRLNALEFRRGAHFETVLQGELGSLPAREA